MSKQKPIEIFTPPNTLRVKVGGGGGGLDLEAIKRAEQALSSMKDEFAVWIDDEIVKLAACRDAFFAALPDAGGLDPFFRAAHDLKGQGATFGFPLVTRIASSLAALLDCGAEPGAIPRKLVDAHVEAIRATVRYSVKNPNDPTATALAGELDRQSKEWIAARATPGANP